MLEPSRESERRFRPEWAEVRTGFSDFGTAAHMSDVLRIKHIYIHTYTHEVNMYIVVCALSNSTYVYIYIYVYFYTHLVDPLLVENMRNTVGINRTQSTNLGPDDLGLNQSAAGRKSSPQPLLGCNGSPYGPESVALPGRRALLADPCPWQGEDPAPEPPPWQLQPVILVNPLSICVEVVCAKPSRTGLRPKARLKGTFTYSLKRKDTPRGRFTGGSSGGKICKRELRQCPC